MLLIRVICLVNVIHYLNFPSKFKLVKINFKYKYIIIYFIDKKIIKINNTFFGQLLDNLKRINIYD